MLNVASLISISALVGFLGSLTGLGGASILIPILVLSGVPIKVAIACSMVSIIATSSGSAASYVRDRITNVRIAMYLEVFTITGAIIGATITTIITPIYLYFFFAAFLLTSFLSIRKLTKGYVPVLQGQDRLSRYLRLKGSYFDRVRKERIYYQATNTILGGAGMLVAGLAAGMLGIGAGAFKVTVQENILKLPAKVSSATSNFIIGMTALAATSVYLFSGLLNLSLMAPIAIGATIGAIAGGRVMERLSDRSLSLLFFIIVTYLFAQMLYKGVTSI